jgi:hypothetical protein
VHNDQPVTNQTEFEAAITAGDHPVITDNGRYEIPRDIPDGHTIKVTGTAKPTLVAYGSSSPRTVAYGSSSPRTEAYDSSSPRTEAYDSSSPLTEAYDSSSPRTEAHDYSSVLHTGHGTVTADEHVTVRVNGDVTVNGGMSVLRIPRTTNPQLVRAGLTRVETHLDEWDQGTWAARTECGTKYCYAGHVLLEVGAQINVEDGTVRVDSLPEQYRDRFGREFVEVSLAAKTVLQVDDVTADRLFHGSNSLDELRELVGEICGDAGAA